jgi:hypothetical protein
MVFVRKAAMAVFALVIVAQFADAGPFRNRRGGGYSNVHTQPASTVSVAADAKPGDACDDALDLVNKDRVAWGLRPFIRDDALTRAAAACVKWRAQRFVSGHTGDDFMFVPEGESATAAGANIDSRPGGGWATCCTDEGWTYAGAAWAVDSYGRLYMHLFVR